MNVLTKCLLHLFCVFICFSREMCRLWNQISGPNDPSIQEKPSVECGSQRSENIQIWPIPGRGIRTWPPHRAVLKDCTCLEFQDVEEGLLPCSEASFHPPGPNSSLLKDFNDFFYHLFSSYEFLRFLVRSTFILMRLLTIFLVVLFMPLCKRLCTHERAYSEPCFCFKYLLIFSVSSGHNCVWIPHSVVLHPKLSLCAKSFLLPLITTLLLCVIVIQIHCLSVLILLRLD